MITAFSIMGLSDAEPAAVLDKVRSGFRWGQAVRLGRGMGLPVERVGKLAGIAGGTLRRRREAGRFSAAESDRLLRVARLFDGALRLFGGDRDAALRWLEQPQRGLGGESPWRYAETEVGALEVERLIGRLEHGVIA